MIRQRRNLVGLSQADLGKLAGVTGRTVKRVEGGRRPEVSTLCGIATALGCMPLTDPRFDLVEVFSAGVTRAVTTAVGESDELAAKWRGFVFAVGERRTAPSWWPSFRKDLATRLAVGALDDLDREVGTGPASVEDESDAEPTEPGSISDAFRDVRAVLRAVDAAMRAEGIGTVVRRHVANRIIWGDPLGPGSDA